MFATPRDKYLAALANAHAAQLGIATAERLQREYDPLHYRFVQTQSGSQPLFALYSPTSDKVIALREGNLTAAQLLAGPHVVPGTPATLGQLFGGLLGLDIVSEREAAAPASAPESTPAPATPSSTQTGPPVQLEQLLAGLFSRRPYPQTPTNSLLKAAETELDVARLRSEQTKEDEDIAQAIRLSLSELDNISADSKGKAAARQPPQSTTTATEIKEIEASFTSLAREWAIPEQLDFSVSPSTSPVLGASLNSMMARLTYSANNQLVRYYHQALSQLVARLTVMDSFGDDDVRRSCEELTEKVEVALAEVESVVEARWRRFVGRERLAAAIP